MKKTPEVEKPKLFSAIRQAYRLAESTGFVAPVNFTALADIIQIQILLAPKGDSLSFEIPKNLQRTLIDIGRSTKSEFDIKFGADRGKVIIEFDGKKSLDKVIQVFEMIRTQNKRAYEAPDLYLGASEMNLDYARDVLNGIILQVENA